MAEKMDEAIQRAKEALNHATATGENPTSQRALEYRLGELIDLLSSSPPPRGAGEPVLPCDVHLPPSTMLTAGVKLSTLLHALELRGMPLSSPPDPAAGWRDIETAPKDGSEVVIRVEETGRRAFWDEELTAWVLCQPVNIETVREPRYWQPTKFAIPPGPPAPKQEGPRP